MRHWAAASLGRWRGRRGTAAGVATLAGAGAQASTMRSARRRPRTTRWVARRGQCLKCVEPHEGLRRSDGAVDERHAVVATRMVQPRSMAALRAAAAGFNECCRFARTTLLRRPSSCRRSIAASRASDFFATRTLGEKFWTSSAGDAPQARLESRRSAAAWHRRERRLQRRAALCAATWGARASARPPSRCSPPTGTKERRKSWLEKYAMELALAAATT